MKVYMHSRFRSFIACMVFCLMLSACADSGSPGETIAPTDIPEDTMASVSAETVTSTSGSDPTGENQTDSIMSHLPEYTYGGELAGTYDMSASGMYYAKGSTTEYDPLLNGNPIVDDLGGGMMCVYGEVTDESVAEQYGADLANAGFTLYAQNELNGNLFSTWCSEEHIVTLSYLKSRNEFSILIEPERDLPGLAQENVYVDRNVACKAILAPTSHTGRENGLCLILQLCDGSFVIVDGGHGIGFYPSDKQGYEETYDDNAEEIYQILYELAPDKDNIVIAAWFFTHPHWDHIGALGPFADMYGDTVKSRAIHFKSSKSEDHSADVGQFRCKPSVCAENAAGFRQI